MEWLDVFKILSGGALVLLGNWINRRWQVADKRDERQAQRQAVQQDQHRVELRQVYAEFIAACIEHIDTGVSVVAAARDAEASREAANRAKQYARLNDIENTAYQLALTTSSETRSSFDEALRRFRTAQFNVDSKAMNVALIDDSLERRNGVLAIIDKRIALPQSSTEEAAFLEALKRFRTELKTLVSDLGGLLGANRWFLHTNNDTFEELATAAKPRLATRTDPESR